MGPGRIRGVAAAEVLLGMVHLDEVGILGLLGQVGDMAGSRGGPKEDLAYGELGVEDHSEEEEEEEEEEADHSHAED